MDMTLSLNSIYERLSSLSLSNKKWLADHLYEDIEHEESAKAQEQKKAFTSSVSKGWEEVNDAIAGKRQLITADDLLLELESLK